MPDETGTRRRVLLAGALALTAALAACNGGSSGFEGFETSSREVEMDEIPEAAREALLTRAAGARIRELEEKVVDGRTVYEAAWLVNGREIETVVAPDGRLVWMKGEDDAEERRPADAADDESWQRSFAVDRADLGPDGDNPYFPLTPGLQLTLEGAGERVAFSVLPETRVVDGVETRVIEERETKGGELVEISRNFFAADRKTGDVYYFGEEVDVYEDGKVVGHPGAWLAGENGVGFGMIMPGTPRVGRRFYLEDAPPDAVERVEITDLHATLRTPFGEFSEVVYCREFNPNEGSVSHKWYAAGIGMIGDDEMRLVALKTPE